MFEQKRVQAQTLPQFIHNAKGLEYLTGNATLDGSDFSVGDEILPGTALYQKDNGHYALVTAPGEGEGDAKLKSPVLTCERVEITDTDNLYHVSALTKGNVYEGLTHGVTEQFKNSNGLFFWY